MPTDVQRGRFGLHRMMTALLFPISLTCCGDVSDVVDSQGTGHALLQWYLPKSTIQVTATFKLKNCTNLANGDVKLDVDATATLTELPVVDLTTRRVIVAENLQSFWRSNTLDITPYDERMVHTIGSKSEDRTAAIAGNILTATTKIASIALKAPSAPPAQSARCGSALTNVTRLNNKVAAAKASLTGTAATPADATQLASDRDTTTITVTDIIDPMFGTQDPPDAVTGLPRAAPVLRTDPNHPKDTPDVAQIAPTVKQLVENKWLQNVSPNYKPLAMMGIFSIQEVTNAAPVVLEHLPENAHYRDPALLTIIAVDAEGREAARSGMAFAQFGITRRLPLKAGIFQTWDINFNFAKDGMPLETKATTVSTGETATGLLNNAAAAASTIQGTVSTYNAANTADAKNIAHNKAETDKWTDYNNCITAKSPNCIKPN